MTDCPQPLRLEDLLAGRLAADADAELSAHVEGCAACQRLLEQLTDVSEPHATADGAGHRLLHLLPALRITPPDGPENRSPPRSPTMPGAAGSERARDGQLPVRVGRYEVEAASWAAAAWALSTRPRPRLKRPAALKMILAAAYAGPEARPLSDRGRSGRPVTAPEYRARSTKSASTTAGRSSLWSTSAAAARRPHPRPAAPAASRR